MEKRPQIWSIAANILNKQSRTADKGGPLGWGLGEVLTTPNRKKYHVTKYSYSKLRTWTDTLVRHKQRKRDIKKWDMGVRTGSIWLRIGTGGGHL